MLLSPYDDPESALEMALHDVAVATERMRQAPPEIRSHYSDVVADLAADLNDIAKESRHGQH
jgi:hypothetical protein